MSTAFLVGELLGRAIGVVWVIAVVLFVAFGYFVPISIFRISRNTRKMSAELERFNDLVASGSLALRYTPEPPPIVRDHGARAAVGAGPLKL